MAEYLRISARFLDPRFHGRGDGGKPEWPPSPLRLMQAIVAANADRIGTHGPLDRALGWLEQQPPPMILAPRCEHTTPYCLSVPNNAMDLVAKAWSKGNYFGAGDSSPATHRTMKTVRPSRMVDGDTVHYLWLIDDAALPDMIDALIDAARRMVALGWGIDLVAGEAERLDNSAISDHPGERWSSTPAASPTALRVPIPGTLGALHDRHIAFIHRMNEKGFVPVPPLTTFNVIGYRRPSDPVGRPCAVFELRHDDGSFCRYPQRKLIHIAGMVRHSAKKAMQRSPPADVGEDWVERYVVGHRNKGEGADKHRQLSYLPLPSIRAPGEPVDQLVRRVMIVAPVGDNAWLEHIAQRLAGQRLVPERGDEFGEMGAPTLIRVHNDTKVAPRYTRPASRWASVTPVILPGHNDRKPAKTRKLIEAALAQSGVDQPCTYEWSPVSRFRNSLTAHKYDRNGRPVYLRPAYLQELTAVHLTITFTDKTNVPGPLAIGAGRHCGFGLMARIES